MRDLETTARIKREDLTDLLEVEAAPAKQRTTARMPAVTLSNLLCIKDDAPLPETIAGTKRARARGTRRDIESLEMRPLTPPPAEATPIVRFRNTAEQRTWPLDRWPVPVLRATNYLRHLPRPVVIAFSASATLVLARLITLL
ncbi:MAG: hypothetical protein JO257_32390 [Deltaproteobacteria bacterium]|nr:hypothetical protein [Deltaproteobacteria bacterium]